MDVKYDMKKYVKSKVQNELMKMIKQKYQVCRKKRVKQKNEICKKILHIIELFIPPQLNFYLFCF